MLDGLGFPRHAVNFDPIHQGYLKEDPARPDGQYLVRHPHQPIVHDALVMTEPEKDRHPYYDWQAGHSDIRFRLLGLVSPAPAIQAGVALHRTRKMGRYDSNDVDRFAALYGHLQRALTIGFRLGSLGTMQQCTTELLDRNPAGIRPDETDGSLRQPTARRHASGMAALSRHHLVGQAG
jgi:hypothetical protein